MALVISAQIALVLMPWLTLTLPWLLLVLRPQPEMLVALAPVVWTPLAVAIVVPLRVLLHWAFFSVGWHYGHNVFERLPAHRWWGRLLRGRTTSRALLVWTMVNLSTGADLVLGARQVPPVAFLRVLIVGALQSTLVFALFGLALTAYVEPILAWITNPSVRPWFASGAVLAGLVVLIGYSRGLLSLGRRPRGAPGQSDGR